jgi:hypothetical protein
MPSSPTGHVPRPAYGQTQPGMTRLISAASLAPAATGLCSALLWACVLEVELPNLPGETVSACSGAIMICAEAASEYRNYRVSAGRIGVSP